MTIAHRSGGPLMDIVVEDSGARNGFLAITSQEYAAHIAFIINTTEEVMRRITWDLMKDFFRYHGGPLAISK